MSLAAMRRPAGERQAKTPRDRPPARTAIVVAGLLLVLIWSTTLALVWRGYEDGVRDWKRIADNSSLSTAAYVHQALAAADLVLKSMQDWAADEGIESDAQLRETMIERRFFDAMRARIVGLPQASVANIIAANGDIINTTRSYPAPSINVATGESFIAAMTAETQGVFVSPLTLSQVTGEWTFFLARPVTAPSGLRLGVVSIGLSNASFTEFFRKVSLHREEAISMFRTDGWLLATTIPIEGLLGRRFEDAMPVRTVKRGLSVAEVVDAPRWADPDDRQARIVAPRPVEGLPILVSTAVGRNIYLADWKTRTYAIVGFAIVLSGVTIFLARHFLGFVARLEKANRLAAERRLLATLLDTPAALCAVLDGEGRILYRNERFATLLGAGADPAGVLSDPELHGAEAVMAYARAGEGVVEVDLRLERPGQAIRFVHVSLSRQLLPDLGQCAILVGHDETERHQAQAAIAQSAKMVILGEMTTGMAHEISQPLNVMRMAAQNALTEIPIADGGLSEADGDSSATTDAAFRKFMAGKLNRIVSQVDRAADIVSRMRIFGRVPQGTPSTFDARDACRSAVRLVDGRLRSMSISIREKLADEPLPVEGYQNLIEQVLVNLLLNARDALKGSPHPEKLVEVSAKRGAKGRILITVADNGPGVPEAIRDRIFEPFYTAKPLGEGTGLGLALSFGIVRDAGGTLSLLPGTTGACFQIDLPADQA